MKHTWVTEEVDGGHVGSAIFWTCPVCGAGGGPVWADKEPRMCFFPGPATPLSLDCEEAKAEIHQVKSSPRFQMLRMRDYRNEAARTLEVLRKKEITGRLAPKCILQLGWPSEDLGPNVTEFKGKGNTSLRLRDALIVSPERIVLDKATRENWKVRKPGLETWDSIPYLDLLSHLRLVYGLP